MTRSLLTIDTPDGAIPAHLWLPEGGTGPGVLLLQEIFGVSRYVERRAQDLADAGYVVLAPEIFWRLGVSRVDEGPDALEEALGLLQRTDWPAAVADGVRALDALRAHEAVAGPVGLVGFCFGGGLAFNVAALSSVDALVSYYGSALPQLLGVEPFGDSDVTQSVLEPAAVAAPSLHHWGLAETPSSRARSSSRSATCSAPSPTSSSRPTRAAGTPSTTRTSCSTTQATRPSPGSGPSTSWQTG